MTLEKLWMLLATITILVNAYTIYKVDKRVDKLEK